MVFERIIEDVDGLGGRFYQTPNSFFVLEEHKMQLEIKTKTRALLLKQQCVAVKTQIGSDVFYVFRSLRWLRN